MTLNKTLNKITLTFQLSLILENSKKVTLFKTFLGHKHNLIYKRAERWCGKEAAKRNCSDWELRWLKDK